MVKVFGYHVKDLQEMDGREGMIRRGTIMKGRKAIAEFFDDGNGGMVDYTPLAGNEAFTEMQFDIARQYAAFGIIVDKHSDFVRPSDFLVDDISMLRDAEKAAKREKKNVVIGTAKSYDSLVFASGVFPSDAQSLPVGFVELVGSYAPGKVDVYRRAG